MSFFLLRCADLKKVDIDLASAFVQKEAIDQRSGSASSIIGISVDTGRSIEGKFNNPRPLEINFSKDVVRKMISLELLFWRLFRGLPCLLPMYRWSIPKFWYHLSQSYAGASMDDFMHRAFEQITGHTTRSRIRESDPQNLVEVCPRSLLQFKKTSGLRVVGSEVNVKYCIGTVRGALFEGMLHEHTM